MPDPIHPIASELHKAAITMRDALLECDFNAEAAFIYHPLDYAWEMHAAYIRRYVRGSVRTLFMGMNPGPFGMAQTGVPFGEVETVKHWMKLEAPVRQPEHSHPKRPVEGLACTRSEVSGRRLWGLFKERYGEAERFFSDHFVLNYCPVIFMSETGRNITPDKLSADVRARMQALCDTHLRSVVRQLKPEYLVGVGAYAESRMQALFSEGFEGKITKVLHPSPASPAANRDWAGTATRQLVQSGVWEDMP